MPVFRGGEKIVAADQTFVPSAINRIVSLLQQHAEELRLDAEVWRKRHLPSLTLRPPASLHLEDAFNNLARNVVGGAIVADLDPEVCYGLICNGSRPVVGNDLMPPAWAFFRLMPNGELGKRREMPRRLGRN